MDFARETWLILITTPVYIVVIGAEILLSFFHNKHYYTSRGTVANIYLTALNFGLDILMYAFCISFLSFFSDYSITNTLSPLLYWIVLLVFEDFMYYLLHYVDHYCRLFWAVHVTHHNSQEFNLTVGFRSSVFQPLYRFLYFIPIALCGFHPVDIMFIYSATQIYGILIHTQTVGKLGFLEWFMSTPSHHRVHHGSNPQYLDRNMGMVFIIWDRLFCTFTEEKEPVKYGLTKNIQTHNPAKVIFHEWMEILSDLKKPSSFKNKFLYIFGPPGYSHDGSKKTSRQLRREHAKNS